MADMINASHSGSPNLKVNSKWLEYLNTAGKSPIKFTLIIMMKSLTTNELNPLIWAPLVRFL